MCPFCWSMLGLIVAGAASTGGLAAVAAKASRQAKAAKEVVSSAFEKAPIEPHEES